MKRITSLLLVAVMVLVMLCGCSDPVYDDLESFLNVEMTEVNANYELLKEEMANWLKSEDLTEFSESAAKVLLPIINDSLDRLADIAPETDEVKALKDKYVSVMNSYKEAFELVVCAVESESEDLIEQANAKLDEGIALLNEYNAELEALAGQLGAEIEY